MYKRHSRSSQAKEVRDSWLANEQASRWRQASKQAHLHVYTSFLFYFVRFLCTTYVAFSACMLFLQMKQNWTHTCLLKVRLHNIFNNKNQTFLVEEETRSCYLRNCFLFNIKLHVTCTTKAFFVCLFVVASLLRKIFASIYRKRVPHLQVEYY